MRLPCWAAFLYLPCLMVACGGGQGGDADREGGGARGNEDGTGGSVLGAGGSATGGTGQGTGGVESNGSGTGGTSQVVLGKDMLVYYGDGGVPPNTFYADYTTYDHWEQAVTPLGGSFVYTDQWPTDLWNFKVVTFVHPGQANGGLPVPDATVSTLEAWIQAGGTFLLIGDVYGELLFDARPTFNALMTSLGVPVQLGMTNLGQGYLLPLDPAHPLGSEVEALECSGYNTLDVVNSAGVERIDQGDIEPRLVAYRLGAGAVVLISDGQCLDRGRGALITEPERAFLTNLMNWPVPLGP